MVSDSQSNEARCLLDFCQSPPDVPQLDYRPSKVAACDQTSVQDITALITSTPELRLRNARPEPQNANTCQQAEQSASQAIQQASQQAAQSIQQASQHLTQSAAQASRSASQGILQAQQSASQSIAAAERSVTSAISSASSAIASAQASAASAISRANGSMQSAQISASAAQSDASRAVLQAGAAVAAATGSAAAAGSSFLAAAAKATQGAEASVSAFGAQASSQLAQASQQVSASQTQAITATQVAIAIVGSVIASTLITILIYFLVTRHKRRAKQRSRNERYPDSAYPSDPKFPVSDQVGTTIAASRQSSPPMTIGSSHGTTSLLSKSFLASGVQMPKNPEIKTSTVSWNPRNPPQPPSLGSWLKVQDKISPIGSINLPTGTNSTLPLGGQLKSPHQSIHKESSKPFTSKPPIRSPKIPILIESKPAVAVVTVPPKRMLTVRKAIAKPLTPAESPSHRESQASVWTDEIPDTGPSPFLPSPRRGPTAPVTVTEGYTMRIPSPKNPRSTAEWMAERSMNRESTKTVMSTRPSFITGLPSNPRAARATMTRMGQPQDEAGALLRAVSNASETRTPGVGKAL